MAVDKTEKESDISSKPKEMSSPMLPEMSESTTSSRRGRKKARKAWKRPVRFSRLPSFGFSGSDFTFDQIPAIFSGYTAGSEDSSSSEMSEDSRSYSQSVSSADENEEISHVRSRAVWKRPTLRRMKTLKSISRIPSMKLRRQLTKKLSGGTQTRQKLKKLRSVKLSSSRNSGSRDDRSQSVMSGEAVGLSQPHYLKPTSSSASKNVGKIQKNLKPNLGATAKKFSGGLTRTRSLRYSGLLRATCSSALKDSKIGNDVSDGKVCRYQYCSLHGHHSHADNVSNVPSLKRFVSMRRRLLMRQKSANRHSVLLKRSLSRKRGSAPGRIVTVRESADEEESSQVTVTVDEESNQEIYEDHVSSSEIHVNDDAESIRRPPEILDLSLVDVGENQDERSSLAIGTEPQTPVLSARKRWANPNADGEESRAEIMDESNRRTEGDMQKNVKLWHLIYQQIKTGLSYETENLGAVKSEETAEDSEKLCGESSGSSQEGSGVMEDEDESKDAQAIEHDKSNAVKLVKQALDEILSEIPDYSSDDKSITGEKTSKHEHVKGDDEDDQGSEVSLSSCASKKHFIAEDTDVSETASTSCVGEETNRRGPKNWSYWKKVILLKRFLKSLENVRNFDQREPRNLSVKHDQGEGETTMGLRRQLIGERKNAQEWMLDYALRQVISTLAPSQKRKVDLLVQAFETVIPTGGFKAHDLGSPSRAEAAAHLENTSEAEMEKENRDEATDLQEVTDRPMQGEPQSENERCEDHMGETMAVSGCLKSDEAVNSSADASLCEEESDGSNSSKEDEKKEHCESETKAGKQNLIKWRNLIYKHMVTSLTVNSGSEHRSEHRLCEEKLVQDSVQLGSVYGIDRIAGGEEDGDDADSPSRAVKLVQHALENILSEIPDRSSDEETVSAVSNSSKQEKQDSRGHDAANGWNNLKKVILLKRFVKSLEKVRKLNPRKVRYLPVEPDFEAENVNLRHGLTERRNDAEQLMLDYALRQAISRLAPFQKRKVALLVHAFDTVLDGSGNVVPLRDDQTCKDSGTSVCDHEAPKQSKTDITSRNDGESSEEGLSPQFLEGSALKPNPKKDGEFNADDRSVTANFSRRWVNQRDLEGEDDGSVKRESKPLLSSVRDVKQRITVEEEKDTKVWSLIYKHMVTGLKTPRDGADRAYGLKASDHHRVFHVAESSTSVEDECRDEGSLQIDVRSSGAVRLVREALEKILSEIPDQSSDGQSVDSDVTTDQELFERHSEFGEELVSSASVAATEHEVHADDKAGEITFKQKSEPESRHKSSEKSSKGWNNLKKVILLRRFVKELGTLTKLSPRTPRTLPLESDPEVEKINLRHQPLEGRKSSEEWMLDYALRQVISTLAPSQKRKVSLLAQAFDTISLQDSGSSCSSPSVAASLRMSRQSSTSSLVQSENDGCSETSQAGRSAKARDSGGSPEASIISDGNTVNDQAKRRSGYSKQEEVPNDSLRDMNEEGTPIVHCNSCSCLEDDGEISTEKPRHPQEEINESELAAAETTNVAPGNTLDKQQCTSLWRLLCKHMESGVADNNGDQMCSEETSKEEENDDEPYSQHRNADGENVELYQNEAAKLLEEVIDGISLPDSEGDDSRDAQKGDTISDPKHLEETSTEDKDPEARRKTETEQMPQARKGWRNLKRVILLKRFVKALEKVRQFNPREPRFLPPNPDPEAEKVNLRHQETQNKRNGEEWMVDYALQDVVAKLPLARRRKVQLLVQAFETISATGN